MATKSNEEQFSYEKSRQKLEQILTELQGQNPNIDQLGRRVKEAVALIKQCRDFLRDTENQVIQALSEVAGDAGGEIPKEPRLPSTDGETPLGEEDDAPF